MQVIGILIAKEDKKPFLIFLQLQGKTANMYTTQLYIFLTLCSYSVISRVHNNVAPTNLLVTRIGPCYDIPDVPVTVSEMSLSTRLYDTSLTGQINISQNINDGWTVMAIMQKCQDIRNLDTCDYFKSFPVIKSGCDDENASDEQELYNMFFHRSLPRMSCPLKAGNYKIINYPIFNEDNYLEVSESKISTSIFGYTFRLEGFSEKTKIFCVEAHLKLLYIREHNWQLSEEVTTAEPSSEEERRASEEK
ncbi:uncharacterized protein ACR2FA_000261 [Aphomia sociella]